MKKIFYTLIASLPFFTSCEEADFGVKASDPQSWEQEETIALPELIANPVATIDLAIVSDSVAIFTPTVNGTIPEGTTLENFRVELITENNTSTLNTSTSGKVATTELQTAIEKAYGKRPTERSFNATVYANIMMNGQASLLKSETTVTAIPVAPHISSGYYMVGDMFAWDAAGMVQFSHSDADVYEDPYFTIMFTTKADNQYWKIIPQEHVDEGNIWGANVVGTAVDGDASLEGALVNTNAQAGKIEKAGMYKMTINMMDYT